MPGIDVPHAVAVGAGCIDARPLSVDHARRRI